MIQLAAALKGTIEAADLCQALGDFNRCQGHAFGKRGRTQSLQPFGQAYLLQSAAVLESTGANRRYGIRQLHACQLGAIECVYSNGLKAVVESDLFQSTFLECITADFRNRARNLNACQTRAIPE